MGLSDAAIAICTKASARGIWWGIWLVTGTEDTALDMHTNGPILGMDPEALVVYTEQFVLDTAEGTVLGTDPTDSNGNTLSRFPASCPYWVLQ